MPFKKGLHYSLNTEFKKGMTPWNKNKVEKFCIQCNKRFEVPFSKNRLKFCSVLCSSINSKGHIVSKKTRQKLAEINRKENHPQWKGGITWDKKYQAEKHKEYRHKLGISKRYREEYLGISHTKEYKKLQRQKRKALLKGGGKLSIQTIQLVYEDNIKKYGTLTCYLCLNPIKFSQDTLEHKIPLSRGGTNEYNNLAIAHRSCNSKKHTKTEEEFIIWRNSQWQRTGAECRKG